MTDKCGSRLMAMGDSIGNCQLCEDLLSDLGKARADNDRLRAALKTIMGEEGEGLMWSERCEMVRRALEPKP